MFCQKCGTENPDNGMFCSKCGNNLKSNVAKVQAERKGIGGKLGKMGIPGFRSGKTWKMALATLVYFLIILVIITPSKSPDNQRSQNDLLPAPTTPLANPISSVDTQPAPTTIQKITPSQSILIKYSSRQANSIGSYTMAAQGKTFMIINLDIENKGYDKFSTNSFYWDVNVNKIKYTISSATFSLDDKLDTVDVLDGGKLKGSIAFEVPLDTTDYTLNYDMPFKNYNIVWEAVK